MKKQVRKILVTNALPYANGPLHLGHLLEFIQSDIWVRFQRLKGHICHFVCGDDAHGTPIMLLAEKQGISPEILTEKIKKLHETELQAFGIDLNYFHTTHSEENRELVYFIFNKLKANGHIEKREIKQAFDVEKNIFLPDRYVKGYCPKCKTSEQYGDSCEKCGSHYSPMELENPISILSNKSPIFKKSTHLFFALNHFTDMLQLWVQSGSLQPEIANKLNEWFDTGLRQWDISRDAPYFGFAIPNYPGQYFYVWLDAPIGYMASFKALCNKEKINFNIFWKDNESTELYHFIGKDIIYFHTLFWPAMLHASGFRKPSGIFVHGFLTINGEKMSKSRGTFMTGAHFRQYFDPEILRYYFASKLGSGVEDIDLNFDHFIKKINSDLIGKLINIPSRCANFIHKYFDGKLADSLEDASLYQQFLTPHEKISCAFEKRQYARAIREIITLADKANQYINNKQPWKLIKEREGMQQAHQVCSMGINLYRMLITYLSPVIPNLAKKSIIFLNLPSLSWNDIKQPLTNHYIHPFRPMLQRVQFNKIKNMIESNQKSSVPDNHKHIDQAKTLNNIEPIAPEISIDIFAKIDLRIARITKAEEVQEAKQLLKLTVDVGSGKTKQIFTGIKKFYQVQDLVGRLTVIIANLKPRQMQFGLSESMMVCASHSEVNGIWLLSPDSGAKPGMRLS